MQSWNCCRTCLSAQNLHPIFNVPGQNEKYTDVIFATTGMKVEPTDSLPQEMCAPCITFINESYKFRRKCEMALKALMDKKHHVVKLEQTNFKTEKEHISIVISDLQDDDFKDFDDNITLDTFQYAYDVAISKDETNGSTDINIDNTVLDLVERPLDAVVSNKRKDLKPVRRKAVKKKEQKAEKEEIQCEHCKKILTSKLSLRNHYKIHTGFDVVCEHCGKKFITRRLLLMHCRAKHGYEKTDKCSYCEYRASNAEQVKIHERLHTGERPYVCGECGAGFHRKSSYLQHIAIHLPEKTVQCELCPARFKSVTLMRIHKSRHRAPQHAFRCGVCGGSFARRRNAARHLARAHALPAHAHAHEHIQRVSIA